MKDETKLPWWFPIVIVTITVCVFEGIKYMNIDPDVVSTIDNIVPLVRDVPNEYFNNHQ